MIAIIDMIPPLPSCVHRELINQLISLTESNPKVFEALTNEFLGTDDDDDDEDEDEDEDDDDDDGSEDDEIAWYDRY